MKMLSVVVAVMLLPGQFRNRAPISLLGGSKLWKLTQDKLDGTGARSGHYPQTFFTEDWKFTFSTLNFKVHSPKKISTLQMC
jgi:hypothetical protein